MSTFDIPKHGMEIKIVPIIDWPALRAKVDSYQSVAPEELVHELVHVYFCHGMKCFEHVGSQHNVHDMLELKYKTFTGRDNNEIKTAAITFLVLQPLGQANIKEIITDMIGNLHLPTPKNLIVEDDNYKIIIQKLRIEAKNKFYSLLENKRIIAAANKIRKRIINDYQITN